CPFPIYYSGSINNCATTAQFSAILAGMLNASTSGLEISLSRKSSIVSSAGIQPNVLSNTGSASSDPS
ncbi:hypothetical protein O5585_27015, partial [Escherichia coli]|nr:hypothetical protein [Escherichia coli]